MAQLNSHQLNGDLDSYKFTCEYICDPEECQSYMKPNSKPLKILTQNIRSLNCNFDSFTTLLARTNTTWDFLILTECRLPSAGCIPELKDYSYVTTKNNNTQNEGVVVYYKSEFCPSIEEPQFDHANCLVVKLTTSTAIIAIYRPPGYKEPLVFNSSLNTLLNKLKHFENIILVGDINIDIVRNTKDLRSWDYLNLLAEFNIHAGHNVPTHDRTCLDHVMIKSNKHFRCLIMHAAITDHSSVAVFLDINNDPLIPDKTKRILDQNKLDTLINCINFAPLYSMDDANEASRFLTVSLTDAINCSTRVVPIARRKRINKPWITPGLLRCMRHRDKLHKMSSRNPEDSDLTITYKRYRNFCNSLLKKVRRAYDRQEIKNACNNSRKL